MIPTNNCLFFIVWRNKYILNIIFYHLRLYNNGQFQKVFKSIKQLNNYQFKFYLNDILLDIDEKKEELQIINNHNNNDNNIIKLLNNINKVEIFKNFIYNYNNNNDNNNNNNNNIITTSINNYNLLNIKSLKIDIHFDQSNILRSLKSLIKLESLDLGINFNSSIPAYSLPPSLTSLNVGASFNQPIEKNSLSVVPLKYLEFGQKFNHAIECEGLLPESLECLKFNGNFNKNLLHLPSCLKELHFESFNQPLEPNQFKSATSLTLLNLGKNFNNLISSNSLPDSLQVIHLGPSFNSEYFSFEYLPSNSLKKIHLGDNFNQVLELELLSNSVESLNFGNSFNKIILAGCNDHEESYEKSTKDYFESYSNVINGNSLKELIFGNNYNKPFLLNLKNESIFNRFNNLEVIQFGLSFNQILPTLSHLHYLRKIQFGNCFNYNLVPNSLPQSLEYLSFGDDYCQDLQDDGELILPSSLKYLSFGSSFSSPLNQLLKHHLKNLFFLKLGGSYQHYILKEELPESLSTLEYKTNSTEIPNGIIPFNSLVIHPQFNKQLESLTVPPSVTHLEFPETLKKQLVKDSLPNSIKSIVFYNYYYDLVPNSIPSKVESITFKTNYNREILEGSLPASIKSIFIGNGNPTLKYDSIPNSLKSITCYNTNNRFIDNSLENSFYHLLKIIKK